MNYKVSPSFFLFWTLCLLLIGLDNLISSSTLPFEHLPFSSFQEWEKEILEGQAYSFVQSEDGGFVIAGHSQHEMLLLKTTSQGEEDWRHTYGADKYDAAWSLCKTSEGGYALAGYTMLTDAQTNAGMALVKTDNLGNKVWSQTFVTEQTSAAYKVFQTNDNGFILGGGGLTRFYLIKTDSRGVMEWNKSYQRMTDPHTMIQTRDGGFLLAGHWVYPGESAIGENEQNIILIKTDSQGNITWTQEYELSNEDILSQMVQTSDGGFVLLARRAGDLETQYREINLVKISSTGSLLWEQYYPPMGAYPSAHPHMTLCQASDGGFYIGGNRGIVIKTDKNGEEEWWVTHGNFNEADHKITSIIQLSDGRIALCGVAGTTNIWLIMMVDPSIVSSTTTASSITVDIVVVVPALIFCGLLQRIRKNKKN